MTRRRSYQWLFILGVSFLIGLTFSVQDYITMNKRGYPTPWSDCWREQLPFWVVWALLAPAIFTMATRFPFEKEKWLKTLAIHIPSAVLFSILHFIIYFSILALLGEKEVTVALTSLGAFFDLLPKLNLGIRMWSYMVFATIGYTIDYYNRYQQGTLLASRLETKLAQAQLQALKMQLHPHFLFNTLNSISALLRKDVEVADRMIARLGDFLRLTLRNSGAQEVTLSEELEFLECYLEIERIRFQDRLTIEMKVDLKACEARVPNLILQPIVENAIRHGISAQSGEGRITIQAARRNGALEIDVTDNGPGLSAEGPKRTGVGLQNTRSRLEQLYGKDFVFELHNRNEGGLSVSLQIPFHTEEKS